MAAGVGKSLPREWLVWPSAQAQGQARKLGGWSRSCGRLSQTLGLGMGGRAPLIKESLQCPPAPQPLGFWEIPAGGVVLLIPEKLPLGAQYPRGRVPGQGWK